MINAVKVHAFSNSKEWRKTSPEEEEGGGRREEGGATLVAETMNVRLVARESETHSEKLDIISPTLGLQSTDGPSLCPITSVPRPLLPTTPSHSPSPPLNSDAVTTSNDEDQE